MKAVFKMDCKCGRMGNLQGVFVAEREDVAILIDNGLRVYFGEVLGKHSDICGAIDKDEIKEVSEDPKVVSLVEEYGLSNGYNPFHYEVNGYVFGEEEDDFEGTVQECVDRIKEESNSKC